MKIFRRTIPVWLLLVSLLFSSCGVKQTTEGYDLVHTAAVERAGQREYGVKFRLNMTFGSENTTMLFAQGSYDADRSGETAVVSASMTQTVLGVSSAAVLSYSDGVATTTVDGTETTETLTDEEFFGRMLYSAPPTYSVETVTNVSQASTAGGITYTVTYDAAAVRESLLALLGENLYTLAMLSKPMTEKTAVSDVTVRFTVDGSALVGWTTEFNVTLYDTMPYNPNGGLQNEEDYTLNVHVTYAAEYS